MHDLTKPEPCRCSHGREWHDSCSKCPCPFFLPKAEKDKLIVAAWRNAYDRRKAKETT